MMAGMDFAYTFCGMSGNDVGSIIQEVLMENKRMAIRDNSKTSVCDKNFGGNRDV